MLLGKKLRRRHQGRLVPPLHRQEHGEKRHDGLTRTHIPLERPIHAPGAGHVPGDLPEHPGLGLGQRKRQGLVEGLDPLVGPVEDDPGASHRLLITDLRLDQLQEEEFVERHAAATGLHTRQGGGAMEFGEGRPQIRKGEFGPRAFGEELLRVQSRQ